MFFQRVYKIFFSSGWDLIMFLNFFQSLVYALTVAAKSSNLRRSAVATEILTIMGDSQPILVEQAKLVSDELIRCAILWHEQWHEALDDASRLYFQVKDRDPTPEISFREGLLANLQKAYPHSGTEHMCVLKFAIYSLLEINCTYVHWIQCTTLQYFSEKCVMHGIVENRKYVILLLVLLKIVICSLVLH